MFRRNENPIRHRRLIDPGGGGNSLRRVILLEDLESGETASAALTRLQAIDEIQQVSIEGTVTGGTFKLTFDGQETAAIDYDADAAAMTSALEGLSNIDPGDVTVKAYDGRWLVQFTGQYTGDDVPLMTVTDNSLTGAYNAVFVTSAFDWVDSGQTLTVLCQIPVGSPTPLKSGFILSVQKLQDGVAYYGVVNAECRDLTFDLGS